MTEFTKIAVTVPTATYATVEQLRRRLGKSRSAVVALALEDWIRSTDISDADRRYVEGYLRIPEAVDEIAAVAAQATSHWQTWAAGAPSRAADVRAVEHDADARQRLAAHPEQEPAPPTAARSDRARRPRSRARKRSAR